VPRTISSLRRGLFICGLAGLAFAPAAHASSVEVVVTLKQPPLAAELARSRSLAFSSLARPRKLLTTSPASRRYLAALASQQRLLQRRIQRTIPGTAVRWRYSVVLNGMSVVVPARDVGRLSSVPGVEQVWPNLRYHELLDRTPQIIHAPDLWGTDLATAGTGMKIGILDQGIDPTHPFFSPSGFSYPRGYPKGQRAFATPKIIVARAFPPRKTTYKLAAKAFDPHGEHGTHVAGIAAGDHDTDADGVIVNGVAPRAFLGNYKVLTVPTPGFGLDGNSTEIAKAIDQAVKDGMDVLNMSFGEPEIAPGRDVVVRAVNGAAQAGVVSVIAAGNEFEDFGRGSVGSPANAAQAISVAATTGGSTNQTPDIVASFSSSGPTPYSLLMKPDVSAPGVAVLSAVPRSQGLWAGFSGTSMASPHVAGGVALLLERHPQWSPAQVKSALESTAVSARSGGVEAPSIRQGGGRIDLLRANDPLIFTAPTGLSFGLVRPGESVTRSLSVTDAGGGSGAWSVAVVQQSGGASVSVTAPAALTVPGAIAVRASAGASATAVDATGFVVLSRNGQTRRLPFWLRVDRPELAAPSRELTRPGVYRGTTVGAPSRASSYRYPDLSTTGFDFPVRLAGPEAVYRVHITRNVANFGVVVSSRERGVGVEPRILLGDDPSRLAGFTALPLDLNPYRSLYGDHRLIAGVVLPAPGVYDVVFDSPADARPGGFTFRMWIGDATPPRIRLVAGGRRAVFAVTDSGAGVDPGAFQARVDGRNRRVAFADGRAYVSLAGLRRRTHTVVLTAADYQETKNMEDVGPILPNTRTIRARVFGP
jgi:subtilisin family serine protease